MTTVTKPVAAERVPVTAPAIRVRDLTKRYGTTTGVEALQFDVPHGIVFGYLGPNGAGKTTTIRLLQGLLRPTRGSAQVAGHDVWSDRRAVHAITGYLPGDFTAYPDLTVRQYLEYLIRLRDGVDHARIAQLAERLELDLRRRIGDLSSGNRQKVGIVQAFMHDPEVLVLDEPTSGLDPLMQRVFLTLVREARDAGRTVFLSSHVLSEVEQIADMVGIVRNGALVVVEQVATLKARAVRRLDLTFADAPPVDALRAQRGVRDLRADGRRVHAVVEGSLQGLMRVAGVAGLDNVVTHEADLEQIFLDYYQTGVRARANAPAGGEEEAGTLEVLLSTPIPRARVLIEKALALLAGVAILAVVLFATMVAFGPFVDLGLGLGYAAAAATSMALLGAEFGLLALAVGAVTGRRGLAAAVAGVAAVVSYLLFALGGLVDEIEPWRFLSPFQHAMGSDPILGGLSGGYVVAMVAVSLAVTVLAAPLLERRDIAV